METKHGLNCYECGKAYESKRSTSKYCGAKCRKLAFQLDKVSVPGNGKNAKSENAKVSVPITVTSHGKHFEKPADVPSVQTVPGSCSKRVQPPLLTLSMLDGLPVGVTRPTGQPNERTKAMTGENLNRRLIGVKSWQRTPEFAEVVHRLLSGKTEGMNLPVWARA